MASDTTAQTPTSDASAPPEPPAQPTPASPPAAAATLTASANGDLATVTGTGLPAGKRLDVAFTAPSGTVLTTAAIVDEDGKVTTYGRLFESGKYKIAVKDSSGHALASTAYTNPAS